MPNTNKCDSCGYLNEEDSAFCEKCGKPLKTKILENSNKCDSCGYLNEEDSVFCEKCGKPLKAKILEYSNKCGNCGEELDEDDKFCPNCGKKIDSTKNKPIIGIIALIAIVIVGGYFGFSAYQTGQFDSNLESAVINMGYMLMYKDEGVEQLINGPRGVGAPTSKASFTMAKTFNLDAKQNLEKCKDFSQTQEEKRLIELLIEQNELYDKYLTLWIKASDLQLDIDLDFRGFDAENNLNSFKTLSMEGNEIETKIENNRLEVIDLLKNYPELKKRWDNIVKTSE